MSTKTCSSCGKVVDESLVFCPDCGGNEFIAAANNDGQSYQQPNYQQPNYQQPNYQQPNYQQPNYQQPNYQQPNYQQPNYQQPNYQTPAYQQPGAVVNDGSGKGVASLILGIISFMSSLSIFGLSMSFIFGSKTDQAREAVKFGELIGNNFKDLLKSVDSYKELIAMIKGIIVVWGLAILIPALIGAILGLTALKSKRKGLAVVGIILCAIAAIVAAIFMFNMLSQYDKI